MLTPNPVDGLFDRGFVLEQLHKDGLKLVASKTKISFSVDSRMLYSHSMEVFPDEKIISLDPGSHAFDFVLDVHWVNSTGTSGSKSVTCAGTFEVTGGRTLFPHLDFALASKTANGYTMETIAPKCTVAPQ